jgi:nucleoside-diphosphate-sugar epimerase
MIGSGKNRYQLLDVADLCESIHFCMTKDPSITNDTFNIGAKQFTTMGEDYQAVLDAVGKHGKVIPFPAGPAIVALRTLERMGISPLYRWVYLGFGVRMRRPGEGRCELESASEWR